MPHEWQDGHGGEGTDIRQITSCSKLKMLPTKRAKDIFKQKANQLIALRVLTELDLEQLAVYANSVDLIFDCLEGMRKPAIPKYDKEGNLTAMLLRLNWLFTARWSKL